MSTVVVFDESDGMHTPPGHTFDIPISQVRVQLMALLYAIPWVISPICPSSNFVRNS